MNQQKCKYKVDVTNAGMWISFYGETIDEINTRIDEIAEKSIKPLKVEIYTRTDMNRHPCLADWKSIETREIQ